MTPASQIIGKRGELDSTEPFNFEHYQQVRYRYNERTHSHVVYLHYDLLSEMYNELLIINRTVSCWKEKKCVEPAGQ